MEAGLDISGWIYHSLAMASEKKVKIFAAPGLEPGTSCQPMHYPVTIAPT